MVPSPAFAEHFTILHYGLFICSPKSLERGRAGMVTWVQVRSRDSVDKACVGQAAGTGGGMQAPGQFGGAAGSWTAPSSAQ